MRTLVKKILSYFLALGKKPRRLVLFVGKRVREHK